MRHSDAESVIQAGWKGHPLPDPLLLPQEEREKTALSGVHIVNLDTTWTLRSIQA